MSALFVCCESGLRDNRKRERTWRLLGGLQNNFPAQSWTTIQQSNRFLYTAILDDCATIQRTQLTNRGTVREQTRRAGSADRLTARV